MSFGRVSRPSGQGFPVVPEPPCSMKTYLRAFFYFLVAASLGASGIIAADEDVADAQPKFLRISATVDGSGRIIFTYGMRCATNTSHWAPPTNAMIFDGESLDGSVGPNPFRVARDRQSSRSPDQEPGS